jgi:hypothetical protein
VVTDDAVEAATAVTTLMRRHRVWERFEGVPADSGG